MSVDEETYYQQFPHEGDFHAGDGHSADELDAATMSPILGRPVVFRRPQRAAGGAAIDKALSITAKKR